MSLKGAAYIAVAWEHPTRKAPDKSIALLHAECAKGALADAGLSKDDVDGYFCAGDAPGGLGPLSMVDYMNLKCRHVDSTDVGGSSYQVAVGHAMEAIAAGRCNIALITRSGRPRSEGQATGTAPRPGNPAAPEMQFEFPYGPATANLYGMCAARHMYEYGTTSEQLAWIKVAASHHAQYNEHAMLRNVVTVEDVVSSPIVSTPLHRLDCCVISDGGGALILTKPEIAKSLKRPLVKVIGVGESPKHQAGGEIDLTFTAARWSGPPAWEMAGIKPSDIKYASIYDSFTITVLMQLEDLGFCERGEAAGFIGARNTAPPSAGNKGGKLPLNTNGGGLSYMHSGMYGMYALQESVRQMRGIAPAQVPGAKISVCHGVGGMFAASGTVIFSNAA